MRIALPLRSQRVPSYLLPPRKRPSQYSPDLYFQQPSPSLKSFLNSPSQTVPFPKCHTPFPSRKPSTKSPSQQQPSAHSQRPLPSGFPFRQPPLYLSPLENNSCPSPCFKNSLNWPRQVLRRARKVPLPCCLFNSHSPSQKSPLGDLHYPYPFLVPLRHSPSNISPLFHQKVPQPSRNPFTNCPRYTPSILRSHPYVFKSSLQLPSQMVRSVTMIPFPLRFSCSISPKQTPSSDLTTWKVGLRTKFLILNPSSIGSQSLRYSTNSSSSGITKRPFFFWKVNLDLPDLGQATALFDFLLAVSLLSMEWNIVLAFLPPSSTYLESDTVEMEETTERLSSEFQLIYRFI